jgi:hypothetical protein
MHLIDQGWASGRLLQETVAVGARQTAMSKDAEAVSSARHRSAADEFRHGCFEVRRVTSREDRGLQAR